MNEIYLLMGCTVAIGAGYTYWSNKRSYNRGLVDAIMMHNDGRLTYESYYEDEEEMLDIKIQSEEYYEE